MSIDIYGSVDIVIPVRRLEERFHVFHDPALEEMATLAFMLGSDMISYYLPAATASTMLGNITSGLFIGLNTGPPTLNGVGVITAANEIPFNNAAGYTQTQRPGVTWGTPAYASNLESVTSTSTQTFNMGASWTPAAIPAFSVWNSATALTVANFLAGGPTAGLSGSIPANATVTFTSSITLNVTG